MVKVAIKQTEYKSMIHFLYFHVLKLYSDQQNDHHYECFLIFKLSYETMMSKAIEIINENFGARVKGKTTSNSTML